MATGFKTFFFSNTAATTVSTADKLVTASGTETNHTTKVAKSTGWGIIFSKGTTGTWAGGGAEASFGDVNGFMIDDTTYEGMTWPANAVVACSLKTEAVTSGFTATPHVRIGKRSSAGVYTEFANIALTSTAFVTTGATTLTGSAAGASPMTFNAGDKVYVQIDGDITVASGSTSATWELFVLGVNDFVAIPANATKTQTAKARVQATVTKTQTSVARVQKTFTLTQTAKARVQITGTKAQTTKARVQNNAVTKTQTAKARVRNTHVTKTQTAIARIKNLAVTKTQTSVTRVRNTAVVKTQTAKATVIARQNSNLVLRADASSAQAFITETLSSPAAPWYVWFLVKFPHETLNALNQPGSGFSDDFMFIGPVGTGHFDDIFLDHDPSNGWSWWTGDATSGPWAPVVPDVWHVVQYGYDGTHSSLVVDNALLGTWADTLILDHIDTGLAESQTLAEVVYIADVRVGSSAGLTNYFGDNFHTGDFSAWSSTSGAVSVVPGNFWRQYATARIASSLTAAQVSVATIQNTASKTQTATAHIGAGASTRSNTQTAKARVSKTISAAQTAIARVSSTVEVIQTTRARISKVRSSTQTAIARVAKTLTASETARARVQNTVSKAQTARARVQNTVSKAQTARARVQNTKNRAQTAIARVSKARNAGQTSIARVQVVRTAAQTAKSRVSSLLTAAQTAKAKLQSINTFNKNQTARARVLNSAAKAQNAAARVSKTLSRSQTAAARIAKALSTAQTAVSRLQVTPNRSQTAVSRLKSTITATQTARTRVQKTFQRNQTSVAHIIAQTPGNPFPFDRATGSGSAGHVGGGPSPTFGAADAPEEGFRRPAGNPAVP